MLKIATISITTQLIFNALLLILHCPGGYSPKLQWKLVNYFSLSACISSQICVLLLWIELYTSAYFQQLPSVGGELICVDSSVCWANAKTCKCRCLPGKAPGIVCSEKHRPPPSARQQNSQTDKHREHHWCIVCSRSGAAASMSCDHVEAVDADRKLMWLLGSHRTVQAINDSPVSCSGWKLPVNSPNRLLLLQPVDLCNSLKIRCYHL